MTQEHVSMNKGRSNGRGKVRSVTRSCDRVRKDLPRRSRALVLFPTDYAFYGAINYIFQHPAPDIGVSTLSLSADPCAIYITRLKVAQDPSLLTNPFDTVYALFLFHFFFLPIA